MNAVRPTQTEPATWVKALSVFLGIPMLLWLAVIGMQGVPRHSGLVVSVGTIQQDSAPGFQEPKQPQAEKTPAVKVTDREVKNEYTKLERQLADLQPLYMKLEQQLASLQTLYSQVEKQLSEIQTLYAESETEVEEEQTDLTTQTPAQESETVPRSGAPTQPSPLSGRYELGAQGPEVERIQQRLQELGHYTGAVDGVFNRETKNAVRAFQNSQGLGADGVVGRKTLRRLTSANVPIASVAIAETQSDDSQSRPIQYTWWAKGPEIERIQKRLQELGHYKGTVDGNFGQSTRRAVKAFQKSQNLPADGVVGAETFLRLFPDN